MLKSLLSLPLNPSLRPALWHDAWEATEVVDRSVRGEGVHAAETAACAGLALSVHTGTSNDGCGRKGSSTIGCSRGSVLASSQDGDGRWGGSGGRVDRLKRARHQGGAVGADGKGFEVGHCLVARGGSVDAEDHALTAMDAVLLFAVEP